MESDANKASNNSRKFKMGKAVSRKNSFDLSKSITSIPMTKFTHLWTIEQFTLMPSDLEFLCSSVFGPSNRKDLWFMKLRPKSIEESSGTEYIGIHLFLKVSEDRNKTNVRAKYVIAILGPDGEPRYTGECSRQEGRIFKAGTEGHGYKLLAPRDTVISPTNGVLGPNESLSILCEVTTFGEHVSSSSSPDSSIFSDTKLLGDTVVDDLRRLLTSNEKMDTTIIGSDGCEVKAHRFVLILRSNVFQAMFTHETIEKEEKVILINDFPSNVIQEMVTFFYTDDVQNYDCACDLLLLADKYNITRLKALCQKHLSTTIEVDTCTNLLAIADMSNGNELKSKVLDFIANNAVKVSLTDSWNKDLNKRPTLYREAFEALAKKQKTM